MSCVSFFDPWWDFTATVAGPFTATLLLMSLPSCPFHSQDVQRLVSTLQEQIVSQFVSLQCSGLIKIIREGILFSRMLNPAEMPPDSVGELLCGLGHHQRVPSGGLRRVCILFTLCCLADRTSP